MDRRPPGPTLFPYTTLFRSSEDAPVVRLVNVLLVDALRRGASDIHVEPYEKELRIRFRIDGMLYDVMHPPLKMREDRKSTRLNSSHGYISYAVFCLKKKKTY